VELRLRVAREVVEEEAPLAEVARVFGLATTTIAEWVRRYRQGGLDALVPKPIVPPPREKAPDPAREAVKAVKVDHPEYGTRRIADVLRRFEALGVAESTVRRILHEEGLLEEREPTPAREHPERRFERAQPNELWQSDIFTFLLRRHERLYLAAFMDDHSRFIVGQAIAHHQRGTLVLEALDRGIAAYGAPREILTDQGRQYTAWRGTTEFEEELRRQGIRHVKSRPQHPQTLGKIERFWKTLWDELLSRTVFSDYADCARRLALFVDGYNFQRPHQALEGLVPADRFFRSAPEVRAAVERSVQANALRLAQEKPPQKPFYLVGRLGDSDLSIAAGADGLRVKVGTEEQTIRMPTEEGHERTEAPRRVEVPAEEEAPLAADAEVDQGAAGAGRDGAAAVPARAVGTVGGEAGVGRDRRERAVAEHLLPAGGEGTGGDATGPGPDPSRAEAGPDRGDRGAPGEGEPSGGGEASRGAAPLAHAEGGEVGAADAAGPGAATLDDGWREAFEQLEPDEQPAGGGGFDPDAGWRGRALNWERKLAGATAESDAPRQEVLDGQEDLRAGAGGPARAAGALHDDAGGDPGADHGERGGAAAEDVSEPLPDAAAPGPGRPAGGDHSGGAGPSGQAGAGGRAGAAERAPEPGEREAAGAGRDDRPAAGGGERGDPRPGAIDADQGDQSGGQ
jgi:transposase InsO family protein